MPSRPPAALSPKGVVSIFEAVATPTAALSKRDAILAAATRVFLRQGYEGTSMDLVAQESGAARRTLYNQFPDGKEELFRAVVERVWSAFPVLDIVAEAETQADPDVGLRRIAAAVAAFWEPPLAIAFLRMIIAEGTRFPDLTESFFKHGKTPAMGAVRAYIEMQAERGLLTIKDGERAARQFLGLIDEPLLWIRVLGRDEKFSQSERQAVIDEAVDIFLGHYRTRRAGR
ncbi:TetR/AcrR family transcriptional regulator [Rhizobium pisi]|uniref:TetR/AcrR family transcriptional regulator n=1 Tax=Rhizobium TaxID=379 RepID=UPI00102F6497|nr:MULTISPECIES: TetR/AcrR family transcriptional regulator [Rhizobium]MBY5806487.1 TetR/AcrR family transcriptional regulator [Rhizobium leguminosarum]TBE73935.1 TetR/AcrR family transcriptional regulator [Rhizobium leguminosarum]TCA60924.1 TetR/AcrR family transcriptional regulator [Rhizobium pisi]